MRRLAVLAVAIAGVLLLPAGPLIAQEGDNAVPLAPVRVGDQFPLAFEAVVPAGTTVEVDTASHLWNPVQVVSIDAIESFDRPGERLVTVRLTLAAFDVGDVQFQPALLVVSGSEVEARSLPPVSLRVVPTLGAAEPLSLSPSPAPRPIAGARPLWVIPAIIAAVAAAAGLFSWLVRRFARWLASRPRPIPVSPEQPPSTDLTGAAASLDSDPVSAYRTLASTVRAALASRYGFPARALTTAELERRMEAEGVDRWQARLVGGLLEECDAVVYAGYRPASERRLADLNMAREILEAG